MSCDGGGGGDFGGGGGDFVGGFHGGYAGGGGGGFGGGGSGLVRKAKVKKAPHGGEEWVIVENHRKIYYNVTQPLPNRQALSGVPIAGTLRRIRYTYGDDLPKKITQATVCAVICSILATPLTLLCIIPMILNLKKVCLILE